MLSLWVQVRLLVLVLREKYNRLNIRVLQDVVNKTADIIISTLRINGKFKSMIAESTRFKTTGSSPSEGAIKQSKGKAETIQAGSRRVRVLPHLQEALLEIGVVVPQELRAPIS